MVEKDNLLLYVCLQVKNTTNPQHGVGTTVAQWLRYCATN
jgi:hypothetical protein